MSFKFYQETNFKQTEIGLLLKEWEVAGERSFIEFENLECDEIKRVFSGDVY